VNREWNTTGWDGDKKQCIFEFDWETSLKSATSDSEKYRRITLKWMSGS
jgi:hypothetical protein